MPSRWEEHVQASEEYARLRESYEKEYSVATLHWRFLQATRIVIIAGFVGALLHIGSTYRGQLIHVATGSGVTRIDNLLLLALPIIGLLTAVIVGIIEEFVTAQLTQTENRARALEINLHIRNGIMSNLVLWVAFRGSRVPVFDHIRRLFDAVAILWAFGIVLAGLTVLRVIN
jgi:hypothetical protein